MSQQPEIRPFCQFWSDIWFPKLLMKIVECLGICNRLPLKCMMLHVCLMTSLSSGIQHYCNHLKPFQSNKEREKTSCVLYYTFKILNNKQTNCTCTWLKFCFLFETIINLLHFTLSHIIQFCTRCKYRKVHRKNNWVYNFTAKVNLLTKFYPLQNKIKKPNIYKYYNFNIIDIILLKLWKTLSEDVAYWV